MVYYNLSFTNSSNTILEVMQGTNTATNGLLFGFFLFTLDLMLFVVFKKYDTKVAFVTSNTITSIIAILLWVTEFISWYIAVFPLVAMVFALFIMLIWS